MTFDDLELQFPARITVRSALPGTALRMLDDLEPVDLPPGTTYELTEDRLAAYHRGWRLALTVPHRYGTTHLVIVRADTGEWRAGTPGPGSSPLVDVTGTDGADVLTELLARIDTYARAQAEHRDRQLEAARPRGRRRR